LRDRVRRNIGARQRCGQVEAPFACFPAILIGDGTPIGA
jgi:hypothetical protein